MPERRTGPEKSSGPETVRRLPADARDLSVETPSSAENEIYDADHQTKVPSSPSKSTMGSWFSREVVHEIKPGEILLDRYRVIQQLGEGGMGQVWLVEDLELQQMRALKTISPKYAFDQEARLRLSNEAKAMARLQNHPNIPIVHDVSPNLRNTSGSQEFQTNQLGFPYIVMEFLPGESLEKLLEPGVPKPLDWALEILTQVCEALEETHHRGIIHRDLKPSNLILTTGPKRRVLKMLDFGIAKMLGEEELPEDLKTVVGAFMGTPPYASPEQAYGYAQPSSDIYSVGVILYELLTGFRPFAGRKKFAVIHATKFDQPQAFIEVNPEVDVPLAIEEVVFRCLAKNPEDRPRTPLDLLKEFRVALGLPEIEPEPAHLLTPTPAPMARRHSPASGSLGRSTTLIEETPKPAVKPSRRALVIGSSLAGLVLVGSVVGWALLPGKPEKIVPVYKPEITWNGREFALWNGKIYLPKGYKPVDSVKLEMVEGYPKLIERDGITFIRILGGSFMMGIDKNDKKYKSEYLQDSEAPHFVAIKSFYLQKYEVSNGELERYEQAKTSGKERVKSKWRDIYKELETNLEKAQKDPELAKLHPAREVRWDLASRFAEAQGGRLPTEAEWEYAARSGQESRVKVWVEKGQNEENDNPANLNNGDESIPTSTGDFFLEDTTIAGVRHMAGNVSEWCSDTWTDPDAPQPETRRMVVRGGSFSGVLLGGYITNRSSSVPDKPASDIGFRIVIECPDLKEGLVDKPASPD